VLYRSDIDKREDLLGHLGPDYRILPKAEHFKGPSSVSIFGDHVAFISGISKPGVASNDSTITIIVNNEIAQTMRGWFDLLWSCSLKSKK